MGATTKCVPVTENVCGFVHVIGIFFLYGIICFKYPFHHHHQQHNYNSQMFRMAGLYLFLPERGFKGHNVPAGGKIMKILRKLHDNENPQFTIFHILMQFQYGAIDTNIIDKLRNEGDLRMRLQVYRPYQILFIHSSILFPSFQYFYLNEYTYFRARKSWTRPLNHWKMSLPCYLN